MATKHVEENTGKRDGKVKDDLEKNGAEVE